MNSNKIISYLNISRPINVLITFFSIPVAYWIAGGSILLEALLAASSGALVTAGANAINDVFDIEIDRINKPSRPLPSGELSIYDAKRFWFITSFFAILINFFVNAYALLIVVFAIALLYYYSFKLKQTVLIGNITVSLMTAMAFIYGGVVSENVLRAIIPALFAFFVNLARELIKDIEDIEGDRQKGAVTFAVKYGVRKSIFLSSIILLMLILITIAVALYGSYNISFLYIVFIADLFFIWIVVTLLKDYSLPKIKRASILLKICMVIGLLSIISGSI